MSAYENALTIAEGVLDALLEEYEEKGRPEALEKYVSWFVACIAVQRGVLSVTPLLEEAPRAS